MFPFSDTVISGAMTPSLLVFLAALLALSRGFYLPGLAPTSYCREEVKKENSDATCKVQALATPRIRKDFTFCLSLISTEQCICPCQQVRLRGDHRALRIHEVQNVEGAGGLEWVADVTLDVLCVFLQL